MHVRLRKIRLLRSRKRRYLARFTRNERGVQLAELAIVLPIPVLGGLDPSNITITKRDSTGAVMAAGVPQTVTVDVTNFKFQPLFNLGGLMNNNGLSLNIDLKPSVTMRYLLTTPCI